MPGKHRLYLAFLVLLVATIGLLLLSERMIGTERSLFSTTTLHAPQVRPQIGLNFIRVLTDDAPQARTSQRGQTSVSEKMVTEPSWVFDDFEALGVQVYRQATEGDAFWKNVEPANDAWDFTSTDTVLSNTQFQPIVTVFAMQYASGTPPWATSPSEFEPELGDEAKEYLDAVLSRYADRVTYWEIGNEMDHWRAADPSVKGGSAPGALTVPSYAPPQGYSPQQQGVFLSQVAEYIREHDADAVILLPGMGGIGFDSYAVDTWLAGVLEGGGSDFFDIVNYHFYGSWEGYVPARQLLTKTLKDFGIDDKPVWLTETGVTSDVSLTERTNYPNSTVEQASDVVRRLAMSYANGDELVLWHTHVSSSDEGVGNDWRAYGLNTTTGERKPAWYTYQLFAHELIPFESVSIVKQERGGAYIYQFAKEDGTTAIVAWGTGSYTPEGTGWEQTSMVASDGIFEYSPVNGSVVLSSTPVLLRPHQP